MKMTVMEWVRSIVAGTPPRKDPPVIMTDWGPVTEKARLQAVINMRIDPKIRAAVEKALVDQYGVDAGIAEARRRYPEVYENETE